VTDTTAGVDRGRPRVLMFSQRNIFETPLFRCPLYEFEDIVCEIDSVEMLAPHAGKNFDMRYAIAKRLAWHSPLTPNPGIARVTPKSTYDLFFAVCGSPVDLLMLNTVANWRDFCGTSICLLDELWLKEMHGYRHMLKILERFDFVLMYYSQSVKPLSEMIGRKCRFLPPGVDALLFSPYPEARERVIDVYSIGRRSDVVHQALSRMARDNGMFYVHDSIAGNMAINSKEHRHLFANMAKRSRYFLVNPARFDQPEVRGDQVEIGNRYFEGAGAGAIMIGERPQNEEFQGLFGWQDAVVDLPYHSTHVESLINEIDRQPERQEQIRRNNVTQALTRHDWAYRWEVVLKTAGLEPLQRLVERKERLRGLATDVANGRETRPVDRRARSIGSYPATHFRQKNASA
jgi:hypothetical protein